MKKIYGKKIIAFTALFAGFIFAFAGCASTGSSEVSEDVKSSIEEAIGEEITWAEDFKLKSYKNLYTEEYALYENQANSMLLYNLFTTSTDAKYIQKNRLVKGNGGKKAEKGDIRDLKKGDIFVTPVLGSSENYIFLITLRNSSEALKVDGNGGVSLPSGVLRHLDRYEGWGVSSGNGTDFEEVTSKNGIVGNRINCGRDTVLYPWVNIDKGEVTYMVLDLKDKILFEYDLKFLGSYAKTNN